MRIARARPSPGTCSRCSTRPTRCRSSGWCSTRSRPRPSATPSTTPATSTVVWSTPRRRGGFSTASTATGRWPTSPARRSGRAARSAGSRASAPVWWSSESASACGSSRASYWDLEGEFATLANADDAARTFGATLVRARRRRAWPPARTSARTVGCAAGWRCSTRPGRPRWPPSWPTPPSRCARSSAGPTAAGRPPRSSPRRSSRKRDASCGCRRRWPCARPRASTRPATSPTCGPTRPRCPRRRWPPPGPRSPSATARSTCPTRPAATPRRSRTPRRRTRPSAPPATRFRSPEQVAREVSRAEAEVYELIWKRTIASQMTDATGETVTVRLGASNRVAGGSVARRRVLDQRHDHRPPGLPPRLRGRPRRGRRRRRAGAPAAAHGRGRPPRRPLDRPAWPRDPAAAPLHRGLAGQAARGAGRRSPVDLRVDHQDHPGPRVRVEEGHGARPVVQGLRGGQPARAALPRPGRLLVHRPHGGRPRRDRRRRPRSSCRGWPSSTSARPTTTASAAAGSRRRSPTRSDQIDAAAVNAIPIGLDPDGVLIVAKPGRENSPYLIRGDDTASIPTTLAPDELTVEKALELLAAPKGGRELGHRPGHRAHRLRQDRSLRALRAARRLRRRGQDQAQDGVAVLDHDGRPRQPRRRPRAAVAAPGGRCRSGRRRRDHRPERPLRARTCRRCCPTTRRTAAA